jgi:hypothetical protein
VVILAAVLIGLSGFVLGVGVRDYFAWRADDRRRRDEAMFP